MTPKKNKLEPWLSEFEQIAKPVYVKMSDGTRTIGILTTVASIGQSLHYIYLRPIGFHFICRHLSQTGSYALPHFRAMTNNIHRTVGI